MSNGLFNDVLGPKAWLCRVGVLILCCLFASVVYAETGAISVSIIDAETKRTLSDAQVQLTSRTQQHYELQSDDSGRVEFDALPVGLYELIVSRAGYHPSSAPSVRAVLNKVTPLRIELSAVRTAVEEVLVVGKVVSVDRLSSAGTSYIDREELRSAAGSGSDILRALDGMPGLFSDGEFASFTVRGNGPRDNLILVDGIPFANVIHFDDSFGEQEDLEGGGRYSVFAPNIIGGAEFQPGGFQAAYGGPAGSLLKLSVAEGNPQTPSYTTRFDIAGIELGYDGPSGIHDDTSILFSMRKLDFGRLFDMIGLEDEGSPELTDVIFKSSSQLGDRDTVSLLAIYAPEEYQRDIENVLASDEDEPGNFEDVELSRNEIDNSLFALSWTRLIGDSSELTTRIYSRDFDERSWTGEGYPDWVPLGTPVSAVPKRDSIVTSRRQESETGLRMDLEVGNSLGRFSTGLRVTQLDLSFALTLDDDWIRYEYNQGDFRPSPEQKYIVLTPESVNNRFDVKRTSHAVYFDQVFEFYDWDLRAGVRYDHDGLSEEDLVSPRFAAGWQLNDRLRLSATLGRYYQAPRFNDLASDADNTGLKNERIDQASVGLRYLISPDLEFFIEPYYQQLQNLIVERDGVNQTFVNTGEGESYGIDMALTRRFAEGWSGNINYSYNNARVKDSAELPYYDADFSRPHAFSIGSVWEVNDRWKISARWKWASGAPRDAAIIHADVLGAGQPLRFSREVTANNVDRFQPYHSLNMRVDYRRTFGNTHMTAFFDVINLYGSENPSSTEFNERTGKDLIEEGESIPLMGLRLEW